MLSSCGSAFQLGHQLIRLAPGPGNMDLRMPCVPCVLGVLGVHRPDSWGHAAAVRPVLSRIGKMDA